MTHVAFVSVILCALLVTTWLLHADGCSNFYLSNQYHLSVRTMDLGTPIDFVVATSPIRTKLVGRSRSTPEVSTVGFVGMVPHVAGLDADGMITAGLSEAGVSCDEQTLIGTQYAAKTNTPHDLEASYFCQWVLGTSTSVHEVKQALLNGSTVVVGDAITNDSNGQHWSVRDKTGASIVVEYIHGTPRVYDDGNDEGVTGFGIMTNEPQWPWHVANVQHYMWKQTMARSATVIPGNYYPDERFLRIHLIKSGLPTPASHGAAMMQAVHVLNTITVPMGAQMGTDSGAGEGQGDHTLFGVIYDHANSTMYFRSVTNQNLQR